MTTAEQHAGEPVTVALEISGMHCGSCVALIEEVLTDTAGVAAATVDLDRAAAEVHYDPGVVSIDELCAAVAGVGYQAIPAEEVPSS